MPIDFTRKRQSLLLTKSKNIIESGGRFIGDEEIGQHQGKTWFVFPDGRLVLYKPDTEKAESLRELEAARIAEALGIPHAIIEEAEYNGTKGIISHNVKLKDASRYVTACKYGEKFLGLLQTANVEISGLALSRVKDSMPKLEDDVVDMVFLDCLIANPDRHGDNWELELDVRDKPVKVCPLFDHGHGFMYDRDVNSRANALAFLWDENGNFDRQDVMFARLCIGYSRQVNKLMHKINKITFENSSFRDFMEKRVTGMNEIFKRTKKLGKYKGIGELVSGAGMMACFCEYEDGSDADRYDDTGLNAVIAEQVDCDVNKEV